MSPPVPPSRMRIARDWLAKGPYAIAASTLQGGMNYVVVLYLSFGSSLAATGEYRTLFSLYALLALTSMMESNKVYIRSVVTESADAATALFANKLACSVLGAVAVAGGWGIGRVAGWIESTDLYFPAIALLSAAIYPFDLYIAHLQAKRRFRALFATESVKYLGALGIFLVVYRLSGSVGMAVTAQLAAMSLCTIAFFAIFARRWVRPAQALRQFYGKLRSQPAKEARTLSAANFLPASLEHVDKLLVGWFFGLTVLGAYTLAYSTGRFLYNILKPAMYVYYRRFVDRMPGWPLLRRVGLAFSLLGLGMSAAFLVALARVPEMAKFESGRWATVILFCSYGVGIVHAAYSQAFALNKETNARHALSANALATLASAVLLGSALVSQPPVALVLLALQYPLRDGLSVLLMERFRRAAPA